MEKKWAEVSVFASLIDARLGKWLTTHHGVGLTVVFESLNHADHQMTGEPAHE